MAGIRHWGFAFVFRGLNEKTQPALISGFVSADSFCISTSPLPLGLIAYPERFCDCCLFICNGEKYGV